MSNETSGEALRIPTLLADESTTKVFESQLKSPVPPVKAVSVPRLVMFGWAAVAIVPVKLLTIKLAAAYPVALVLTVVDGTVWVSVNNLNVLSVEAS